MRGRPAFPVRAIEEWTGVTTLRASWSRARSPGATGTGRRLTGPGLALVAALTMTGGLTGCADDPPPEASGDYPDIADSPSEPPAVPAASERAEVAEGLMADRRESRYAEGGGTRQRSSEVRPPEFSPPAEPPAETSLADRIDSGERPPAEPMPVGQGIDRTELPAPPGGERGMGPTVTAGTPVPGAFEPAEPLVAGAPVSGMVPPTEPGMLPAPALPPSPYGGGPIVVDSRGVTTTGPAGALTSAGPYPVAAVGPAGAQALTAYGPMPGARSQRVAVIYFADGSANLSGRDLQVLGQVAALQRQYGGVLRVIGHASSRTGAMDIARHKLANFNVSLARANNVADALMRAGVPGRFLYVGAASDSQPVYLEIMPTGEAGNRRTEIYLDY
jgi:outer membrane protein OmpA-like peptidoglycan-associated protein